MEVAELDIDVLRRLDRDDREKMMYFLRLLLNQPKYAKLKEEVMRRREEVKRGDSLTHEEVWRRLDVQDNLS